MVWKCFFCDEMFTKVEPAREHFGLDEEWQPGCIDPLTKDEKERRRYILELTTELEGERNKNADLENMAYLYERDQRDLQRVFGVRTALQACNRYEELRFELSELRKLTDQKVTEAEPKNSS